MSRTPSTSRRRALALAAGGTLGTLAGCLGSFGPFGDDGNDGSDDEFVDTTDTPEPEYGHWFDADSGYAGTVDRRGDDRVTIAVGAGNGLRLDPAAVWVDYDTTVRWEWTGEAGVHDVVTYDGPAAIESKLVDGADHEYAVTVSEADEGVTRYSCRPHQGVGERGAIVVGPDVESYVTEYDTTPVDYGDWFAETPNASTTANPLRRDAVTVRVGGPGGYDPEAEEWDTAPVYETPALRVTPGTTVRWRWVPGAGEHSVTAEDGSFESDLVAVEAAESPEDQEDEHVFEHSFSEPGIHRYACERHRENGMRGAVVVEPSRH
ncbi:plastocyanin/azurin family copper-binding protein [Halorubrum sp. 2020YC2]|uniref:plastocyanin/azurin family copper-binding protein n=1 Tax=Halorubrum sp. 2020YC2 TaxID=2836432 RepID=UPI001BED2B29|nr:plastocyanin/azurin family copper-binding protein [Halorubrum sp. 2020YC2]QWC20689.1 halocyanin domain-containing protein [Halorubrum sp. 2020YC2]